MSVRKMLGRLGQGIHAGIDKDHSRSSTILRFWKASMCTPSQSLTKLTGITCTAIHQDSGNHKAVMITSMAIV